MMEARDWISVADRLPDEDIEVLVCTVSESVLLAHMSGGVWLDYRVTAFDFEYDGVTHWMDHVLPEGG